jgi:hypothetical protein
MSQLKNLKMVFAKTNKKKNEKKNDTTRIMGKLLHK